MSQLADGYQKKTKEYQNKLKIKLKEYGFRYRVTAKKLKIESPDKTEVSSIVAHLIQRKMPSDENKQNFLKRVNLYVDQEIPIAKLLGEINRNPRHV